MKKTVLVLFTIILLGLGGIYSINYFSLQSLMNTLIKNDNRNSGIDVSVHYKYYIIPTSLVYDLRGISGPKTKMDVFRVLLQFAEKIDSKQFDEIILCYKGEERFLLDGSYYQTIGREYCIQNPVYTMRTFPENVKNTNGTSAFSSWSGGWPGVMSKQLEDFNEFNDGWYLN